MTALDPQPAASEGYALALEEARRTLDEQERTVAQLSVRAGVLLSAAAIVTSFLGAPVISRDDVDVAAWIAIIAFLALGATALSILWPRRDWEFSFHPATLVGSYLEPVTRSPMPLHRIHREVALHMSASADRNGLAIDAMVTAFHISGVLLAVEIAAWVAAIVADV